MPTPRELQIQRALDEAEDQDFAETERDRQTRKIEGEIRHGVRDAWDGIGCGCEAFSYPAGRAGHVVARCTKCGAEYVNHTPRRCTA